MKRLILQVLKVLLAMAGLVFSTHLLIAGDIPGVGHDQTYFVVSAGHQAVHYDRYENMPRRVFFHAQSGQQVKLKNPSPHQQIVVAYNYATGQTTEVSDYATLRNNDYLITIRSKTGQTMAVTKLEVIRD